MKSGITGWVSDSGSLKQLIFILFKFQTEGVSCLAPPPGVGASKKSWGNTTIKQVSAATITVASLQNASESTGRKTPFYNFSSCPHSLFLKDTVEIFVLHPRAPAGQLYSMHTQNWHAAKLALVLME